MNKPQEISSLFALSARQAMFKVGQIVEGSIVDITSDHVLVDANLKSEAFVPISQFDTAPQELEIGKKLRFSIILIDGGKGDLVLSRDRARLLEILNNLENLMKEDSPVEGEIIKQVRGGYTVMINKARAFLPNSLAGGVIEISDQPLPIEVKVIRVDYERNNIIVSRKAALYAQLKENRQKVLRGLQEGENIFGIVKNITRFGAFVDLGGLDALIHISDLSWKRIKHPDEVLKLGDKIEAKVIKVQDNRISLGIKQLEGDPWLRIQEDLKLGDEVLGRVNHITEYGCFIVLPSGVEGLIHSSEMSWSSGRVNPSKILSVGEEVKAKVIDMNSEKRRIAFSMKACMDNPWEELARQHKPNDIIKGKVLSSTEFGIFVSLTDQVDGLVHISDLSWHLPPEEALQQFTVGQEIDTLLLKIEPETQRVTLGVKQLQPDPLQDFIAKHPIGSKVEGRIKEKAKNYLLVELEDNILGQIPRDKLEEDLALGESALMKINSVNTSMRLIMLSTKSPRAQQKKIDHPASSFGSLIMEKMQEHSAETKKQEE